MNIAHEIFNVIPIGANDWEKQMLFGAFNCNFRFSIAFNFGFNKKWIAERNTQKNWTKAN